MIKPMTGIISERKCQPIKPVSNNLNKVNFKHVSPTRSQLLNKVNKLEVKYDLACRTAAFYKQKYQELKTNKTCVI